MRRLSLYTDGACSNNAMASKQLCPTGWGVVVLSLEKKGNEEQEEVMAELFGPVELNHESKYYLGAELGLDSFTLPFASPISHLPSPISLSFSLTLSLFVSWVP